MTQYEWYWKKKNDCAGQFYLGNRQLDDYLFEVVAGMERVKSNVAFPSWHRA